MKNQEKVAEFVEKYDMEASPDYRLVDLVSEVGEVADDVSKSTGYGKRPEDVEVKEDEIGDVMFALLALADSLDVDAGEALDTAIEKYERRIRSKGAPDSGG